MPVIILSSSELSVGSPAPVTVITSHKSSNLSKFSLNSFNISSAL